MCGSSDPKSTKICFGEITQIHLNESINLLHITNVSYWSGYMDDILVSGPHSAHTYHVGDIPDNM